MERKFTQREIIAQQEAFKQSVEKCNAAKKDLECAQMISMNLQNAYKNGCIDEEEFFAVEEEEVRLQSEYNTLKKKMKYEAAKLRLMLENKEIG